MIFTSYAQNFEDVMLWRALKHVENGCYVDVGAQHPVVDSVSKAFYEHGWRGVHIEPVPHYADLLRQDRPDEMVLQVALSDTEGTLELNVIPETGLSTAVDIYAERHHADQGFEIRRILVPVLTLKSALRSLTGKSIHWLKIDVEGLEEQVLKGWDSQTLRPWVIVVEATIPNSIETDYASWDPILTAADYQFVYFDGLNRFYVAKEHAELAAAFSCPPNVFDSVQLSGLASSELCRGLIARQHAREQELITQAETRAAQADARATQAETRAAQADARATQAETRAAQADARTTQAETRAAQADARATQAETRAALVDARAQAEALTAQAQTELHNILNSRSWRLTAQLRVVGGALRRVRAAIKEQRIISGTKRRIKSVLIKVAQWTMSQPRLKQVALSALNRMPAMKRRLRSIIQGSENAPSGLQAEKNGPDELSSRAAHIYDELKKAIDARKS